ncbi:MAG: serine/threonine-protein kinase [Kofleriaceae bacterium]
MTADQWTGRVIDGRYVVESLLGQGGMGVVLRARHKFTHAQVALKMLQPNLVENEDVQERFLAEARAPTTIGHPGIVSVLDAGRTPAGELYLAMELLAGRTLRQAMYPTVPAEIARRILLELLDALGAAHARGIVHRDLKPENVFLAGPAQTVKLLDFGIAKILETSTRVAQFTAAGAVLGTLAYMAPEQLSDASSVDLRTDLWAVGVMLYELLSGHLPFRANSFADLVVALASRDPDPIASHVRVTPDVEAFFARALARDRTLRFGNAREMAQAISQLMLDGAPSAQMMVPVTAASTVVTGYGTAAGAVGTPVSSPVAIPLLPPPTNVQPVQPVYAPVPHVPPPPYAAQTPLGTPPSSYVRSPSHHPPAAPVKAFPWIWIAVGGTLVIFVIVIAALQSGGEPNEPAIDRPGPGAEPATQPEQEAVSCQSVCSMMNACRLTDDDCVASCERSPVIRACGSQSTCEAFASCVFAKACNNAGPTGVRSCGDTAVCQLKCGGSEEEKQRCACDCMTNMAPTNVLLLYRVDGCASKYCPTNDPECLKRSCTEPIGLCAL